MALEQKITHLTEIYDKKYDELIAIARTMVHKNEIAADILQEVMLRILENPRKLEVVKDCKSFLCVCIRNEAIDYYRKAKRSTATDPYLLEVLDLQEEENVIGEVETQLTLKALLKEYPAPIREAFIKYALFSYPIELLAKELNMKPNTLSKVFGRIRKAIIAKYPLLFTMFFSLIFAILFLIIGLLNVV